MAKIKVYELAKEIDKQSKDVMNYLKDQGVEVKSHMSNIDDSSVNLVKKHFTPQEKSMNSPVVNQAAPTQSAPTQSAPAQSAPAQSAPAQSASTQSAPTQSAPSQESVQTRPASTGQQNVRPAGTGYSNQNSQGGNRPNQNTSQTQRPMGQGVQNRPTNNQNSRPNPNNRYQSGEQGQRPIGENGQQTQRPIGENTQNRPMNGQTGSSSSTGQYNQNRPTNGQQSRPSSYGNNPNARPNQTGTTSGRPYQNGSSTGRPYQSGTTSDRPNQSGTSTGRPYQAGASTGRPYQAGTSTGRPNQTGTSTGRPYQAGASTGRPYQAGTSTGRPNQTGTSTSRPYNNSSTQGNRPGQTGGYNNQSRPGQQGGNSGTSGGYQNKSYGAGSSGNYRSNDTRAADAKKLDAPQGMSRSDTVNNRNSRTNTFNKNSNKNYTHKNIETENKNRNKNPNRKGQFIQPKPLQVQGSKVDEIKTIIIPTILTIKELADFMKLPASAIVKKLFLAGKVVSINQEITYEEAEEIALEFEVIAQPEVKVNVIAELLKEEDEDETTFVKRPAVVCVMGHVDHGKTSLLDAIRETHVTSHEAGGITQHIGAYVVDINGEKITFLDTPGHEAFTSMRMRGAQSTDIAILVVAADDGVMPQTVEAINHAKAAGIQIIVAINKIDKPSANIERVKQELVEYKLVAEDWGGDTIFVPVSAQTKEGIDQLLEMIILTAEMAELKANPNRNARGIVIEAELDKGRGPVATILVQKGTLHVGDSIAIGAAFGKVRAMMDDKGKRVKEATPSTPVEILGLNEVPDAGETFMATDNEKEARIISETYISQGRVKLLSDTKAKLSLDGLFSQIKAGNIKDLNLIVKADVQGSVEAIRQSLLKLSNEEVAIRIIHGGVGAINESDVTLASASNAIIIGFNVRPDNTAKETAEREKVDLRLYRVIYNAIDDVEAAMKGMLDPIFEEKVIGHAEVRQVFKASGLGTIAGSYVVEGKVTRGCSARILRGGIVIFDGVLSSLKRFKDDTKEVASGYECGLVFDKYNDIKELDAVELYIMQEIPR